MNAPGADPAASGTSSRAPESRSGCGGVVVGVDGSKCAAHALRWAAGDAGLRRVPLTIVGALPPPDGALVAAPPASVLARLEQSVRDMLAEYRDLAISSADPSLAVVTAMPSSTASAALVDASRTASLVVVGRRGRSAVTRALLGSVSAAVLHGAHCPVAVVHDAEPPADADAPVLVGVDGSHQGDVALEVACYEASLRGVDLVAVHAWWTPGAWELPVADLEALQRDLDGWLADRLQVWERRYPGVSIRRVIVRDRPARRLLDMPRRPQLVVVGSHGRRGVSGLLLGSVSNAVVQSADVPVIVAR